MQDVRRSGIDAGGEGLQMHTAVRLSLVFALAVPIMSSVATGRRASAAMPPPPIHRATDMRPPDQRTGDVIARFRPGVPLASVAGTLAATGTDAKSSSAGSGLVLLHPAVGESVDDAVSRLRAQGDIAYAEPDVLMSVAATPNDTYFPGYQWDMTQMSLPAAWDTTTGNASIVVAVVDTGVDATHPDLSGKLVAGWNIITGTAASADDNSHGTFVAGIIGANSNNGAGMAGVCWLCKIMPVKVMDSTGNGSTYNVASGINWAVAHGANIVNLSLGSSSGIAALQTAVDDAWAAGVIVVAATGNDNGPVLFPAAYPNVIAVGSNDPAGNRSSFSNFGPEIDVMAPGSGTETSPGVFANDILGTLCTCNGNAGGYATGHGTSFAAPHVSGLVGLMMANGITDKTTIVGKLKATATDMSPAGFDNNSGWGRVNAALSVASTDTTGPLVAITAPANGASVSGTAPFTATASDASGVQKVRFWVDSTYLGYDSTAPYGATWNTALFAPGAHTLKVEALDTLNNSTITTISATVLGGDTTPPAASITAPANGATISGNGIGFTASASDPSGIQKVRFWIDSTYLGYDSAAPYARIWNSTAFTNGPHTLKIEAWDNAANARSVTIGVTVSNADAVPPTVSLTSPPNGATVSGSAVSISARAADNIAVQKVRFWVDGTYLGYDSTAPYAMSWNTTTATNGAHALKVQAVDNAGNVSAYATVSVTVSN